MWNGLVWAVRQVGQAVPYLLIALPLFIHVPLQLDQFLILLLQLTLHLADFIPEEARVSPPCRALRNSHEWKNSITMQQPYFLTHLYTLHSTFRALMPEVQRVTCADKATLSVYKTDNSLQPCGISLLIWAVGQVRKFVPKSWVTRYQGQKINKLNGNVILVNFQLWSKLIIYSLINQYSSIEVCNYYYFLF